MTDDVPAAVTVSDLQQSFGDVTVLDGVSLSAASGDIVAVVGPNGSGKSTFLELLVGVRAADGGSIELGGGEVDRRVGYLPQRPTFREGFTARDTLEFYARFLADADVPGTLERVGLSGVSDRTVGSLSGGMTRLLGLGQAILGSPDVLVLDEPGSGLDPAMVERLFAVVGELAADGTAVVVASHNLAAVEMHADTVALLDRGRFAAVGPPTDLLSETETETLVGAFLAIVEGGEGGSTVRASAGDGEATDR